MFAVFADSSAARRVFQDRDVGFYECICCLGIHCQPSFELDVSVEENVVGLEAVVFKGFTCLLS
jgi:hypothetical protein